LKIIIIIIIIIIINLVNLGSKYGIPHIVCPYKLGYPKYLGQFHTNYIIYKKLKISKTISSKSINIVKEK
jgi:hypothetical protein